MSSPASERGLVLDANILIRLVLGTRVRELVLSHIEVVSFFAPAVCFQDAEKYLPNLLARESPGWFLPSYLADLLDRLINGEPSGVDDCLGQFVIESVVSPSFEPVDVIPDPGPALAGQATRTKVSD